MNPARIGLVGLVITLALPAAADEPLVIREGLAIGRVGTGGRSPLHVDAIEAAIVEGHWSPPKEGDSVAVPRGERKVWEAIRAGEDGAFGGRSLSGGYLFADVASQSRRIAILEAAGHSIVTVNGVPRTGDPYSTGYVRLPVVLEEGDNALLFQVARGRLKASLVEPKGAAYFDLSDATLPDAILGEGGPSWLGIVAINAGERALEGLVVEAIAGDGPALRSPVPPIPPLANRKLAVHVDVRETGPAESCPVTLRLLRPGAVDVAIDEAEVALRVREPDQSHKRTFLSAIDGSVQYYAVNPARPPAGVGGDRRPALFLTLHGAGVEAIGQADAYEAKSWGHLVAPTNRRPYGFDWEDWGRLDAIEVLERAQRTLGTDPSRMYLTGHSMGGHGTWHLGATFPDRFAAIGPSAGWISMASYAGARRPEGDEDLVDLLARAAAPSDTLALATNYAPLGVYVLHGADDDNVPAEQARMMTAKLDIFHRDWAYHEQPGAGHWWDASDEPGTDCVDWAPMFDLFARRSLPAEDAVRLVDFATASPGVSSSAWWLTIEDQLHPLQPSRAIVRLDPGLRRFSGTTENVARLALDLRAIPEGLLQIELDGHTIIDVPRPEADRLHLERRGDGWGVADPPSPDRKGPHRYGPFKAAFRNRMVFVHGTGGTPEEDAWALAKARLDAERFWYQGNGSVDVVPDTAFDPAADPDRNVILYGHAGMLTCWEALLGESPVQVGRGSVRVGGRTFEGDDLACLFLRPRPGSDRASVGVVAGSGLVGLRLTERLPYFVSGVEYPDCLVLTPRMLTEGVGGVEAAGYFGSDWGVDSGEFAWKSTTPDATSASARRPAGTVLASE